MEGDVIVVDRDDAVTWQALGVQPVFGGLYALVEAKDHANGVGRMEGKSFIGICQQLRRQPCVEAFVSSKNITNNARLMLANNGGPFGRLAFYERVSPLLADIPFVTLFVSDLAIRLAARL